MDGHSPNCIINMPKRYACECGYSEWCERVAKAAKKWADATDTPSILKLRDELWLMIWKSNEGKSDDEKDSTKE